MFRWLAISWVTEQGKGQSIGAVDIYPNHEEIDDIDMLPSCKEGSHVILTE